MNDYQVLQKKFENFQKFVKEVSTSPQKMSQFSMLSHDQWLILASKNIAPYFENNTIGKAVSEVMDYMGIDKSNVEHTNKIQRYLECFSEYLLQDKVKEMVKEKEVTVDKSDPYLEALSKLNA
jgi:hypothetical protein